MKKTLLFNFIKSTFFSIKNTKYIYLLFIFISSTVINAQIRSSSLQPISIKKDICIYKPDPNPVKNFIPPSVITKNRMSRGSACTTINVNYTGFSTEAQTAFQYAVDIWASTIDSSIPITIDADFSDLGEGILGGAGPTSYIGLQGGGLPEVTWFSIALANALTASDNNDASPEIFASFSSTFPFYFGTDGNPGTDEYDFVSVVLHEIGHGLGFTGFGNEQLDINDNPTGLGEIRAQGFASIWDHNIENGFEESILDVEDPSIALLTELTGDDLYSNSSTANIQNGNTNPQTYAPDPFNDGSSYSHWDEAYYPSGNANSLMTPFIGAEEAIHDPGPVTLGFMKDMFWSLCGDPLSTSIFDKVVLFEYYPNPANKNITLKSQSNIQNVTVFNILAQKIMQTTPNSYETNLDLSKLSNGPYFLEVTINNTKKTIKIIKD